MHGTMHFEDIDIHIEGPPGAPTIVMVHGWPDTSSLWDRQVEALKADYRCVRFTLPGYAPGSDRRAYSFDEIVRTLAGVVDTVSPAGTVSLMLHDWGCVFGYGYTLFAPERVSAVMMFDVGDGNSPELDAELGRTAKALRDGYQKSLVWAWHRGGRVGDWISRTMARVLGFRGDLGRVHSVMNYPYVIARQNPDQIAMGAVIAHPTFFLYGTRKPFMFQSTHWVDRLKSIEECEVVAVAAGHWVMRQKADEVNSAVTTWLARRDLHAPGEANG